MRVFQSFTPVREVVRKNLVAIRMDILNPGKIQSLKYTRRLDALVRLSKSFERSGVLPEFGFRCARELFNAKWHRYLESPSFQTARALLKDVVVFQSGARPFDSALPVSSTLWYSRHVLFSMPYAGGHRPYKDGVTDLVAVGTEVGDFGERGIFPFLKFR